MKYFVFIFLLLTSCGGFNTNNQETVEKKDFIPLPLTKTNANVYSKQVLDNFVSCLGLGKASDRAINTWNSRKGSVAEWGFATTLTAPMLMSITSIAGETCQDLLNLERPLPMDQRRIFKEVDFTQGWNNQSTQFLENSIRRLTRSCWGRNETKSELDILTKAVEQNVESQTNSNQTIKSILFTCTAILSSPKAIEM